MQSINMQHLKQKHIDDLAALREENDLITDKEVPKLVSEMSVR